MNITVGCDPEFFLQRVSKNGNLLEFVSAHGLIPGDKEHPHKVECGAVQVDGMAVEINIDPARTAIEFSYRIATVKKHLQEMLGNGYRIVAKPWTRFGKSVWENTPAEAKILGCDPDYNAYTGEQNIPPNAEVDFRTAAGHVHIGWTEGADIADAMHMQACRTVIQELDIVIGLVSVILDGGTKRRQLYGKAGCFRPKSYGVEYRTPSPFWLDDRELRVWIFNSVKRSIERLSVHEGFCQSDLYRAKEVEKAINTSNKYAAAKILQNLEVSITLPFKIWSKVARYVR